LEFDKQGVCPLLFKVEDASIGRIPAHKEACIQFHLHRIKAIDASAGHSNRPTEIITWCPGCQEVWQIGIAAERRHEDHKWILSSGSDVQPAIDAQQVPTRILARHSIGMVNLPEICSTRSHDGIIEGLSAGAEAWAEVVVIVTGGTGIQWDPRKLHGVHDSLVKEDLENTIPKGIWIIGQCQ
jgi:hypothetical protein